MSRRLNVERMRRHARRRPPRWLMSRRERWEFMIASCGLTVIGGPWPCDTVDEALALGDDDREMLRWEQSASGITVDGILGVQSWLAIASRNEAFRALDC